MTFWYLRMEQNNPCMVYSRPWINLLAFLVYPILDLLMKFWYLRMEQNTCCMVYSESWISLLEFLDCTSMDQNQRFILPERIVWPQIKKMRTKVWVLGPNLLEIWWCIKPQKSGQRSNMNPSLTEFEVLFSLGLTGLFLLMAGFN